MIEIKKNISNVVNNYLCNACGGCYGVCPVDAIKFYETIGGYYLPRVDDKKCKFCGLCYEICPGISLCESLLMNIPDNPFTGSFIGAYLGKALNEKLFKNSQSGGVVSALLLKGLSDGIISGAATVTMENGSPSRPRVIIARNADDIFRSQKSKYVPVPLLSFLKELNEEDGPIAVVGTSCQIHGLNNILERFPKLKSKIAFTIGLFCDRVMTNASIDYLAKISGIISYKEFLLNFRDKSASGYPGDIRIFFDNGQSIVIPSMIRKLIKDCFTPVRCRVCFDKMNIFSDISVGDPHGLKGFKKKAGASVFIVRTQAGKTLFRSALNDNFISCKTISPEKLFEGQKIEQKKNDWRNYIEAMNQDGNDLPNYFKLISMHTPVATKIKKYRKILLYSYNLDNFSSRDELFQHVDMRLKRSNLLIPLQKILDLLKKLSNTIFKAFKQNLSKSS